jgi:uncharacterized membrane protein YdjX (TVP38/TMEM64 family)
MTPTTRQATLIAALFVLLVGAIVVTALIVYDIDDFLKVWAVLGTLVGILTGAIPSFFFAKTMTASQEEARVANRRYENAEQKLETVFAMAPSEIWTRARQSRPDLWGPERPDVWDPEQGE